MMVLSRKIELTTKGMAESFRLCKIIHPAASSIFSIKILYPLVGSFPGTCVTAPTSFPFCKTGEPITSDWYWSLGRASDMRRSEGTALLVVVMYNNIAA